MSSCNAFNFAFILSLRFCSTNKGREPHKHSTKQNNTNTGKQNRIIIGLVIFYLLCLVVHRRRPIPFPFPRNLTLPFNLLNFENILYSPTFHQRNMFLCFCFLKKLFFILLDTGSGEGPPSPWRCSWSRSNSSSPTLPSSSPPHSRRPPRRWRWCAERGERQRRETGPRISGK